MQQLLFGDFGNGSVVIDDIDMVGGGFRVEYNGNWIIGSQCGNICFNGNDYYLKEVGVMVIYYFIGNYIVIYVFLGLDYGIVIFVFDGELFLLLLSYYDEVRVGEQFIYLSFKLEDGEYIFMIMVIGDGFVGVMDIYVIIDWVEVYFEN